MMFALVGSKQNSPARLGAGSLPALACTRGVKAAVVAFAVIASGLGLLAQPVTTPVASTIASESARPAPTSAAEGAGSLSNITSAFSSDLPLFRSGPFAFRPHATYRYVDQNGLETRPGEQVQTTIQTFAPGLLIEAGDHWRADYTGTWTRYSTAAFSNNFDQAASVNGTYSYIDWTFGLSGGYSTEHPVLVETAQQTHNVQYQVGLSASRTLGQHSSLDLSASQSYRKATPVDGAVGWTPSGGRSWSSSDYFRYTFTPKLNASIGATFGHDNQVIGASSSYVRPEVRIGWTPVDTVSVTATAGSERRRFHGSSASTMTNPTYSAGIRYRPFATTTVSLDATKGVSTSYLADSLSKSTSWRAGLEQRFLGFLYFSGGYSQQKTTYVQTLQALPSLRDDDVRSYDARLSMPVLQRGSVGVFYQRSRNSSSLNTYSFSSRQIGGDVSIQF